MAERTVSGPGSEAATRAESSASPLLVPVAIGEQIGPYRVLEKLGEGGFGIVYRARQKEPIRREVALKVLKLGMDTAEVIARFEAERQALAIMDHPGVARVFDAGATERGRPYFVMELVHGVAITRYCDQNRLSLRARIGLFIDVCRAVQHAHTKGIIHRDLKPSNILVTLSDGRPLPKVIDFGIAKAVDRSLATSEFTVAGQLIGTPAYMSPEQVEEIDLDTRTDVYALGVVLYLLLVGRLPFEVDLRTRSAAEMANRLREREPLRASGRAQDDGEGARQRAECRGTVPQEHARQLEGDLDSILFKALDRDRSRRYQTAEALAADLNRHLEHQVVLATPPTPWYTLGKFVRRHRVGVLAGSLIALALLVGLLLALFGLARATRSAAEARRAAAEATAVVGFLQEMLEQADPWQSGGRVSIEEALDRAAANVETAFADQPTVSASVHQTIGASYRALGETAKAEPLLITAERLRTEHQGPEHAQTFAARLELAGLRVAMDDLDAAHEIVHAVVERASEVLGEGHEVIDDGKEWLAVISSAEGDRETAERLSRELFERALSEQGEAAEDTVRSRNNLAWMLIRSGRFAEAQRHFQAVYEHHREHSGAAHPKTIAALNGLAETHLRDRNVEEAERLFRQALELSLSSFGDTHPHTGIALTGLGHLLRDQGSVEEAEGYLRRALELLRERLGPDHQNTLNVTTHYALTLTDLERYAEAEELLLENLERRRRVLPANHPDIGHGLGTLGDHYFRRGSYSQAEHYLRQAVAQQRRAFGRDTHEVAGELADLAMAVERQGRLEEALALLEEVLIVDRRNLSPDHLFVADDLAELGRVLQQLGRHREAAERLRQSRQIEIQKNGDTSGRVAELDSRLAVSLTHLGELEEGERLLLRAIEILGELEGAEGDHATAVERLILLYEAWERPQQAERWRRS